MNELDKAALEAIDSGKLYFGKDCSSSRFIIATMIYLGESIAFRHIVVEEFRSLQSQCPPKRIWVFRIRKGQGDWGCSALSQEDYAFSTEVQEKLNDMRKAYFLAQEKDEKDKELAKINAWAEMVREEVKK